jgi:cell fate regulator YaaT (PSP1 superfamily)
MDNNKAIQPEGETVSDSDTVNANSKIEIIGIRFKKSGKIYYFDPDGMIFMPGDHAIVETQRGLEYGNVVIGNRMVNITEIVSPLRRVIRAATPEDEAHHKENAVKEIEAFNICIEKISEHRLDMKLIDVEYTFDNNKLLFYFTADGRIDFRELVKDLASVFRTRIELRQIGIRDEAKLMGGLGVCGRPFCCHSFLGDFTQVSIKMAKEQNLSLNSAKISGACGRLMCCLRYEYDVYSEELKKTPRVDAIVGTADGDGVVIETVPLAGLIKVRLQKLPEQPIKIYHRDDVKIKGYMNSETDSRDDEELEDFEDL